MVDWDSMILNVTFSNMQTDLVSHGPCHCLKLFKFLYSFICQLVCTIISIIYMLDM